MRKRVGGVFNRRQEEFETLLDWNNYLEEVESLVFDIVEGSDVVRKKAEESLKAYAEEYKAEIQESARAEREEKEVTRRMQALAADGAFRERMAAVKAEEEEKADVARMKRQTLDALAKGDGDARQITRRVQKTILETSERRRGDLAKSVAVESATRAREEGLTIRGLKKKTGPIEKKPYDPFDGLDLTASRYVLQDSYENEWLGGAVNDTRHMVGGYSLQEYYARTMFEAFSGLGVFIDSEVGEREASTKARLPPVASSNDVF